MGNLPSQFWGPSPSPAPSQELRLDSVVRLRNGVAMPRLGFGVWQVAPSACTRACEAALAAGYRHLDSAQAYGNEAEAGAALRSGGAPPRADVFFTTKIARDRGGEDADHASLVGSVRRVHGVGDGDDDGGRAAYVDLFLVHTPRMGPDAVRHVWRALERLLAEGGTRSIGVSNFGVDDIEGMRAYATVWPPHVNQIELNPWRQQREVVRYCQAQGIVLQAYSPLATGRRLDDPTVGAVASRYHKSPAQVLIRYGLQKGWVPLPKSVHEERIVENTQLYDFAISPEDMDILDGLDGAED